MVRGDERTVSALDPGFQGIRRHSHGLDALTSDAEAARRAVGDTGVVERASFEDIVILLEQGEHHA